MCHDNDSRPPAPPQIGPVGAHGVTELSSQSNKAISAAYAMPDGRPRAGIVVLPDVRGLHPYYIELTQRLAEAGLAAVAVDYFSRTAESAVPHGRPDDFNWRELLPLVTNDDVDADTSVAIEFLRSRTREDLPVLTLGFCFGGSNAWRQSSSQLDLVGCMGFYGQPVRVGDAALHAAIPTLLLIAGADTASTPESQRDLAQVMREAGAYVQDIVYPDAPHSFFDRSYAQWADTCSDAWLRILEFIERVV